MTGASGNRNTARQGGDEINLIEQDANYGWPYVTYGTDYGAKDLVAEPRRARPRNSS